MPDIKAETLTLNGVEYVKKDSIAAFQPAVSLEGLEYCVIRTKNAGVFCGYIKERNGMEGTILRARRLWYWEGAASLSQLAMEGVTEPSKCKFPCEVDSVTLTEIIEIIPCSEKARICISNVKIWAM
jgi:hypothetical protein